MSPLIFGLALLVVVAVLAVTGLLWWAWRSSATRFPSDETLRHPRPDVAEPLIREDSRHRDTPAAADLNRPGGREHRH